MQYDVFHRRIIVKTFKGVINLFTESLIQPFKILLFYVLVHNAGIFFKILGLKGEVRIVHGYFQQLYPYHTGRAFTKSWNTTHVFRYKITQTYKQKVKKKKKNWHYYEP